MSDKPGRRAAALKYRGGGTPTLVAKGEDASADRIRELAAAHDIPLVQDAVLTNLLSAIPLGEEIPENLYVAVAEVLALIYRIGDSVDTHE